VSGLTFTHHWQPPADPAGPVILALHGTGGNELDLVPLAEALLPGAGILSPRGQVIENGMPRFFRRLAEGVFDVEDLKQRTRDLAAFVEEAGAAYDFPSSRVIAVGYSNGANIAASLLLAFPGLIPRAVLFKAMVPFEPTDDPDLSGTRAFIGAGRHDPLIPPQGPQRLAAILEDAGADVLVHWSNAGHDLTPGEVDGARAWIMKHVEATP
jgi:phospholipase/carboxylesterase